jgi:protein O-GlcNAc transferase
MSKRDEAQNLQRAFSLHRSGKFADAAKLYRKVIKSNPRESHALHSLGTHAMAQVYSHNRRGGAG